MPSRSLLIRVASWLSACWRRSQPLLLAVEFRVSDAELPESRRRASVPLLNENVFHVAEILDADPARPESGRRQIAKAVEEGDAGRHGRRGSRRPRDVVEDRLTLRY